MRFLIWRKLSLRNLLIVSLTAYAFIISIAFFYLVIPRNYNFFDDKSVAISLDAESLARAERNRSNPIDYDNLLDYSIKTGIINVIVNQAARDLDPKLPPIKIDKSELSYKSLDARRWIIYQDGYLVIPLYRDVSNTLNPIEVMAVAMHELCHESLGHNIFRHGYKRELKNEIAADECTIYTGVVEPETLIAALGKLDADEQEKAERIQALRKLMKK